MVPRTWGRILQREVFIWQQNSACHHSLVQPWSQIGPFPEQYSNHSQNTYTVTDCSLPDLHCRSSIPTPGKWSDRTKEGLTFLSNTPSLIMGVKQLQTVAQKDSLLERQFSPVKPAVKAGWTVRSTSYHTP